jgi:metal-sulfur cluster biosynthetic enzyme
MSAEDTATAPTSSPEAAVTPPDGPAKAPSDPAAGSSADAAATPPAGEATTVPDGETATAGETPTAAPAGGKAAIADIEEAMKDVVDPELGINVVDLGLVYGVHVDDENVATIDMTLTSAACPLTDEIEAQCRQALTTGPGGGLVNDFRINWVWIPPWGPDKITDDGREQLRALGFNV